MHGTGNDFVVIADFDDKVELSVDAVRFLCDRHFGIGGDGLIRITRSHKALYFMDYINADGSTVEMCGNATRVVGKYLGDRGYALDTVALETRSSIKQLSLHRGDKGNLVESVTVDMGPPLGEIVERSFDVGTMIVEATLVSMGNPHAVIFVSDVESAPVDVVGPSLEMNPFFLGRTNVEFVEVLSKGGLRQRTWERGVGETLACGTGACAVMVAAHRRNLVGSSARIELRGGTIELEYEPGGSVMMTGQAVEVATGTFNEELLRSNLATEAVAGSAG